VELHTRIGRTGLTSTATAITRPWTCNLVFGSKRSWSCREGVHKRVPGSLSRAKVTFLCRWQGRLGDRSVPQRLDGAKRALFGCPRIAPGLSQVPYSTNHSATRSLERESDQKRSSPLGDHAEERLVLFVSPSVALSTSEHPQLAPAFECETPHRNETAPASWIECWRPFPRLCLPLKSILKPRFERKVPFARNRGRVIAPLFG
jgi:hypothetical protein